MPVALWLLGLLRACACLESECVLGTVGRPVTLPCFHLDLVTPVNFTLEWRIGDAVVLRSEWDQYGHVGGWTTNWESISTDAPFTGNMSLKLPTVDATESETYYSLYMISEGNESAPMCTVCLRVAASFSSPLLERHEGDEGQETAFSCQSSGGFPKPAVYWLINDTEEPPEGSVTTLTASLPESSLYNITSHLRVNISRDASVSCIIENPSMNQTLTSINYGARGAPVIGRASEAMWMFSTGLCVVVGIMVMVGVAYQIHQDRISKRRKKEFNSQRLNSEQKGLYMNSEETESMKPQSKETDV